MDAFLTGPSDLTYSAAPPILIAGSSDGAINKAARAVEAGGRRVANRMTIDAAAEGVRHQPAASAIWIEVDQDSGAALDTLLDQVNRDVSDGRYAAVIAIEHELVDLVLARIHEPAIEILVSGNDADRAAGLAAALASSGRSGRLSDIAADKNAARIRQLSEEVSRIASTLARLSEGPAAPVHRFPVSSGQTAPDVSAETVRAVIRARRLRSRYFPEELFADPAWDMLLDLLQAEICHLRVPVSSLCIAAAVPATTALRWLKTMVQEGLFLRRADPHDGRRVFVELAPQASDALRRYFSEVNHAAVI